MKPTRTPLVRWWHAVGWSAVVVIGMFGCRNTWEAFSHDSRAAGDACTLPRAASGNRDQFVRWASGLVFLHDTRAARLHQFTHPRGGMARVEVSSPARGRDRVRHGCVIGRIVSNYADTSFGFIAGTTYIWADSSSPDGVQLVPDDGTTSMTGYEMAIVPMVDGKEPVVSGTPTKHICGECTKNDWCVYPRNTVQTEPAEAPTIPSG
jgi:hypothetical protein